MKIPRDVSGVGLAGRLEILGYSITRQTGSHIRLMTRMEGEHHITIPSHKSIKIGTLNSILGDIAVHFRIRKEDLIKKLW
ncbi:MAG TPA: type II toxin-antitoxin system HicA family toxin [Spirochaetota bacterium]|nr:MAG: YcfA-like protein [Spirochaetes bacterium ADurb.BinA120]HPI15720.1 type II toxin-antitoxin system HicA family toxin [Spirochaetota bacterium]HPO46392.1 type II toxin-antitoxin system HicA family toxin [Spirochaetota bacterium]